MIQCPNCGESFGEDVPGIAKIIKQVRDQEFSKEITAREKSLSEKQATEKELAITKTASQFEKQIAELQKELDQKDGVLQLEKTRKDSVIKELQSKLELADSEKKIAIQKTLSELEKEKVQLQSALELKDKDMQIIVKQKDEEIARFKDMKAKLSTKMVGETLEKHCKTEFEQRIRPFTLGQKITFEKDTKNDSRGDYIYRELDQNDNPVVSIMFEMKNEEEDSKTKQTNESHLKKLDQVRRDKKCDYAVLVSLLEVDNETYNMGIVDKSYLYPKMFVVRPQFFVTIITLLRNTAQNAMEYKQELMLIKNQSIDVTNFENYLNDYRDYIEENVERGKKKHNQAIELLKSQRDGIQKIIDLLEGSNKNFRLANDKAQDLSIKKLSHGNKTMTEVFDKMKKEKPSETA